MFTSPQAVVRYIDTEDHFEHGLLRLMNLDRNEFARWLELCEQQAEGDLLARLRRGWQTLRPRRRRRLATTSGPVGPGPRGLTGRVWHAAIGESPGAWGGDLGRGVPWLARALGLGTLRLRAAAALL